MTDQEVRIRCIEAAAAVPGNPNTLPLAREFYAFVREGVVETETVATASGSGSSATVVKKTARK